MSEDLFDDVAQLREEHYLISVDDFGTGYSNLCGQTPVAGFF